MDEAADAVPFRKSDRPGLSNYGDTIPNCGRRDASARRPGLAGTRVRVGATPVSDETAPAAFQAGRSASRKYPTSRAASASFLYICSMP